jgi:hypothetical protein
MRHLVPIFLALWACSPTPPPGSDAGPDASVDAPLTVCNPACAPGEYCIVGVCYVLVSDAGPEASPDAVVVDTVSDGPAPVDVIEAAPVNPCGAGFSFCQIPGDPNVGMCVNTQNDPQNCGSCYNSCLGQSGCIAGQCMCITGRTLCPGPVGTDSNFCWDLTSDPNNCGACGNSCHSGMCVNSQCTCGPGYAQCGNECISTQFNDIRHCGGCNNDCSDGGFCIVDSSGHGIGCSG